MSPHHFLFLLGLLSLSAKADTSALRASQPRVLFVFDASQSMYGKLPGSSQNKLELAKAVMQSALEAWPADIQVGLLAYGHRGRRAPGGDRCRDIELLVPVGDHAAAEVQGRIARLLANGTTPLCAALTEASVHLKSETTPGTLILISDGTEECGGDLQKTIRQLASTSTNLAVDILSLGQTAAQNAPLAELTDLTSGHLFDIRQEKEARTAMASIMAALVERTNFRITAHDQWDQEARTSVPLKWALHGVEKDAQGKRPLVAAFQGPGLHLQVTPGLYWVTARSPQHRYGLQVHVPEGKVATKRLSLALGETELIPTALPSEATWSYQVFPLMPDESDDVEACASGANVTGKQVLKLANGQYRLDYRRDGTAFHHSIPIVIEAERLRAYDVPFDVSSS